MKYLVKNIENIIKMNKCICGKLFLQEKIFKVFINFPKTIYIKNNQKYIKFSFKVKFY